MKEQEWDQEVTLRSEDADISDLVESLRVAAERPEGFWCIQRSAIQERIQAGEQGTSLRLAWAGSVALIAVAAGMLTQTPAPASALATYDPDHDLLVGVEQAVRRPVPQALEPAQLLAQELERSVETAGKTNSQ